MDISQIINLIKLALQIPDKEGVKVNTHRGKLEGQTREVSGTFDRATKTADIAFVDDPKNPGTRNLRTIIHELSHAQRLFSPGEQGNRFGFVGNAIPTLNQLFINDLVAQGKLPDVEDTVHDRPNRDYINSVLDTAIEVGLPSAKTRKLEEVRASLASYYVAKEFGLPVDKYLEASVEKFSAKHPEVTEWVASGLGSRFVGSPRLKIPQQ